MNILISNDDGIHALGLSILVKHVKCMAKFHVVVVAPDRNRSGASNSLTLESPLRVRDLGDFRLSVEGTPTDCVHLATTGLLESRPDMVVAGINEGANLGDDILYSGTVAAAIEGRFLGLPAIAISLAIPEKTVINTYHYETAGIVAVKLINQLTTHPLPANTILNINVPNIPFSDIVGFKVTRLGSRHIAEHTIAQIDPRGHPIYWIGPSGAAQNAGPGTDFHAIYTNHVSITPLHVDLTHYQSLNSIAKWVEHL